jgi:hypothetical protein
VIISIVFIAEFAEIEIPPAPLKKEGELNSSPFLRGIEGDLFIRRSCFLR